MLDSNTFRGSWVMGALMVFSLFNHEIAKGDVQGPPEIVKEGQLARPEQPRQATAKERIAQGLPLEGDITSPVVLRSGFPEYSTAARRDRVEGTVTISMVVDTKGKPTQMSVVVPLGHGLCEQAIAAAKQYRFSPATQDGKPIAWKMKVEMSFQLR